MQLHDTSILIARNGKRFVARRLTLADGKTLQAFNTSLSPESEHRFRPHAYDEATVQMVLERSEAGEDLTLGVFEGARQVGYCFLWYFTRAVPLLGIGLADECQGIGIGRQLMELLIGEARAAGRDGIELTTMMQNHNAYALYEKTGFIYHGDVENLQGDGSIVVERAMYYAIVPGSHPPKGAHAPPV